MRESCEPPRPALQNPHGDLSADALCEKPARASGGRDCDEPIREQATGNRLREGVAACHARC